MDISARKLCCGLCLFISAGMSAQPNNVNSANSSRDERALQALARCSEAMGLPDRDAAVVLRGSIIDVDHAGAIARELLVKESGRSRERWEEHGVNTTLTRIVSGDRGVLIRNGRRSPLAISETILHVPELLPAYACKLGGMHESADLQYLGLEERNGTRVEHIRLGQSGQRAKTHDEEIDAALLKVDIYLNAETHIVSSICRNSFAADNYDNYLPVEFVYRNFQSETGTQIPRSVDHVFNGKLIESVSILSVSIGGSIAADDFK